MATAEDRGPDDGLVKVGYYLFRRQWRWLKQRGLDNGTDASAELRDLLDEQMNPPPTAADQEGDR